jgi:2-(1,2-epoxy-1,2-dihydrophenyl)acetyl-CoA isomerase
MTTCKEFEIFSFEIKDEIAVFSLKGKTLFNAANLFEMDQLAKTFRECADDNRIKVIVIKKSPQKKGSQEYREFVQHASQDKGNLDLNRMLTFYNRFIMEVYSQKRFVVSMDSDNIIAQFFNLSLVCDYRIIADNTVIEKEYLRNGVVPKGGATFFLNQIVGKSKAYEILLSDKNITAREALDWGLVDEVVPFSELDEATMKRALEFAKVPKHTLTGIKSLMNYKATELEKYLSYENDVIVKIFAELKSEQRNRQ